VLGGEQADLRPVPSERKYLPKDSSKHWSGTARICRVGSYPLHSLSERVTGERIRDKIAASKRKGMWMGGVVPLGYDLEDRHLVVNP